MPPMGPLRILEIDVVSQNRLITIKNREFYLFLINKIGFMIQVVNFREL